MTSQDNFDVRRVAMLVANGEMPLPKDLPHEQLQAIARDVRERWRRRLVNHIARAIAHDIYCTRKQIGDSNVKTSFRSKTHIPSRSVPSDELGATE